MEAFRNKARQLLQETGGERHSREEGDFSSIEKSLPRDMGSVLSIPLGDRLSSYLGAHNPVAQNIDPKSEAVWLFDNIAYRPVHFYPHAEQPWQAEYLVAYFRKNAGKNVSDAVANIADQVGLGEKGAKRAEGEKTISERLQLFVETVAPARSVDLRFPDGPRRLGPGGRSAVSETIVSDLGDHKDGDRISIEAIPPESAPYGQMTTHFAAPEGWMVISGILTPIPPANTLKAR